MVELHTFTIACMHHTVNDGIVLGETKVILNEGMPQYKNIDIRGRLIIEFKVHA